MTLQQAFKEYKEKEPGQGNMQCIFLPLRRGGVDTLEQLSEIYRQNPEKLQSLRGIGPWRMELIREILTFYQK